MDISKAAMQVDILVSIGEFPDSLRFSSRTFKTFGHTCKAPFYLVPGLSLFGNKHCGNTEQLLHIKGSFNETLWMSKVLTPRFIVFSLQDMTHLP